jgi:neutral ceramidase
MHFPYEWVPSIVEIQILRLGSFAVLSVPGELTTMAGRRLRGAVADAVGAAWGPDLTLVVAGLTNTYASYVTTWEEYQEQRYEGGFTLYGPLTLDAYIQEFRRLAAAMVAGAPTPPGPSPPNLLGKQWSLVPGVVADGVPAGRAFGQPSADVGRARFAPGDTVRVEFHSACPRNDLRSGGTFLTVERRRGGRARARGLRSAAAAGLWRLWGGWGGDAGGEAGGGWEVVYTDDDWETKFSWRRPSAWATHSFATVAWAVPRGAAPGTYRIRHFGDYKHFLGTVHPFNGSSSEFEVGEAGEAVGFWGRLGRALGRRGLW